MTTTTGLPARAATRKVPVALAFGVSLAVSSGVGGVAFVDAPYQWTRTPLAETRLTAVKQTGTSTGVKSSHGAPAAGVAATAAEDVTALRTLSGLTTEQVAKLFGVTRRSVHNWIAGDPMAPHHRERLTHVLEVVRATAGETPAARRAVLLDSSKGDSLFHRLTTGTTKYAVTRVTVPTVQERLLG